MLLPDAKGQLTSHSVVGSCRVTNSSEILWLSCKNEEDPKMKALEWSQHLLRNNPMEDICCNGKQSSVSIWPKTKCSPSLIQ